MTDEQINVAIAEACGWIVTTPSFGIPPTQTAFSKLHGYDVLPNYCTDLNAMHEAEKYLEADSWYDYALRLNEVCWHWALIHAPARQRAEAFLRTLGKWEE